MKISIRNINYLIVVGFVWLTLGIAASAGTLTSVKVAAAPVIDGTPDASWSNAAIYTNIQFGGFLEDFLFTQEEFLQAMAKYHNAIWPMPWILFFIGIGALAALISRWPFRRPIILGVLSFLWLWDGTIVFGYFFSGYIPHASFVPQALFFSLQGILFMIIAVRPKEYLDFDFSRSPYEVIGIALILFALIGWPLIGDITGQFYPAFPVFAEPCPLTIFTFGILLCSKSRVPWYFMLIPFLWSLTGLIGLIQLGISDDFIQFLVGVSVTPTILMKNRTLDRKAVA